MPTIRILHASDLHIAKVPNLVAVPDRVSAGISLGNVFSRSGLKALTRTALVSSYDPTLLLSLAEFVNDDYESNHVQGRGAPIDAIVLTGDIATTGRAKDLERARRFLEDPYDPGAPAQQLTAPGEGSISRVLGHDGCSCPDPVLLMLMPGNHDRLRRARLTGYSPGGTKFDHVLHKHWASAAHLKSHGNDVRELEIVKGSLRVSVIAADFNLKDRRDRQGRWWYKYAQGRVYHGRSTPRILGNLVLATRRAPAGAVVLLATHFPPRFPYIPPSMKLIDDSYLIRAANRRGVSAVLSGHTHEPVRYRAPGMDSEVLCAGTATQHHSSPGHYFHVVEINGNDLSDATITVEHYKYDKAGVFSEV
ncbi:MAG TPA: metallophosphoesterase [Pyrinomonadaceae bacterium]|jgi:3',5'-cyclic AMP phosphodiesterase CpdA|nr:metallophosphoesterase [Pyrinomonadaceae bacterium]